MEKPLILHHYLNRALQITCDKPWRFDQAQYGILNYKCQSDLVKKISGVSIIQRLVDQSALLHHKQFKMVRLGTVLLFAAVSVALL